MLNQKLLLNRLAYCYFVILAVLLLFGCSSTPIVQYRDVPVYIHTMAFEDTLYLKDTVYTETKDTLWYSDVLDSLDEKIGSVEVYYKKKIARLKLDARIDTFVVSYPDTQWVKTSDPIEIIIIKVIGSISKALPFWQNLIIIIVLMGAVIIIIKLKKDK